MRQLVLATLLLPHVAAADTTDEHLDVSSSAETGAHGGAYEQAGFTYSAGHSEADDNGVTIGHISGIGDAGIRYRSGVQLTADAHAELVVGENEPGLPFPWLDVSADGNVGIEPSLAASRDTLRGDYHSGEARAQFLLGYKHDGDRAWGAFGGMITGGIRAQDDLRAHTYGLEALLYFRCHLRSHAPARCIDILIVDSVAIHGPHTVTLDNLSVARVRGLALPLGFYGEVAAGVIDDTGTFTVSQQGQTVDTITTTDLPLFATYGGHATIARSGTNVDITATANRRGYVSLGGDLSIENRADLGVRYHGKPSLELGAFVADTTWWTSKSAPPARATTAGIELSAQHAMSGFVLRPDIAVGRTFYPVLDGAAPDAPALAATASLRISRLLARSASHEPS